MKRFGTYSIAIFMILFLTVSGSGLQIYLNTCLTCGTKTVVLDENETCSISFKVDIDREGEQVAPICCKRDKISPEINLNIVPVENISLTAASAGIVKFSYSYRIQEDDNSYYLDLYARNDRIPRVSLPDYLVRANKITYDDDNTLS